MNALKMSFFVSLLPTIFACQSATQKTYPDYSVIYSFKESKTRSIYLSDETGQSRLKLADVTPSDGYPSVSPDGQYFAFYGKYDKFKTWSIHVGKTDGTEIKRLTHVKHVWDSAPAWSLDGETVIFAREYEDAAGEWQEEIWLMNRDGSEQRKIEGLVGRSPVFMQDGRILFQSKSGPSQICIADADGSNIIQLTNEETDNMSPKISPDGKRIAYLSNRDGNQELYVMDVDGSNNQRMTFNEVQEWDPAWTVDGEKVLFISENSNDFYDVFTINKDGSSLNRILLNGSQVSSVENLNESAVNALIEMNQK